MNELFIELKHLLPNPYQPRQHEDFSVVLELAENIERNATMEFDGLLQAPTVRPIGDQGDYQLAFGHTRKAAFQELVNQGKSRYERMRVYVRDLTDVQMFEAAVAENIKRRDLNPIEQAESMRRYMDEFGKTSAEAGEFFNCSEENVRAKVRLLNLPEPVQVKMRAGEVNENTARALLQMQRVTSPEVIAKTVERIEKKDGDSTPEQVIENTIEHLDNVTEFRNGRGWPLNMKKFPNKLLPTLTEDEAVIALGIGENQKAMQLVSEYLEYLEADSMGPGDEGFDQELYDACKPEMQKRLEALAKINPIYVEKLQHLINPPACTTACPFYTTIRGSHYCGMKVCYGRKSVAWEAHSIDQASKSLKIPVYNKAADGGYVLLAGYESSHKKVFTNRHTDLRLLPKSAADRYASQWGFDGVNGDHVLVVATGQALDKLDTTSRNRSKGGKKTEKEKAEMRMMRVYRMRRKEFLWEFTAIAKSVFDGVSVDVIKKLKGWHFVSVDDKIPDEWLKGKKANASVEADFERRELIWRMIDDVCSYYTRSSMLTILKNLQERSGKWNVKIPARLTKLAEQFDAEISAAATPKAAK